MVLHDIKMIVMGPGKIVVNVLVKKPVALVWEKWTNPEDVRQWNIPFDNWHCPHALIDLKEGGHFVFRMEEQTRKEGYDLRGQYNTIVPYQLIRYTLDDGRGAAIEFQHIDQNTIIRESFEPEKSMSAEGQQAVCQSVLERFKKYVETS